MSIDTALVAYCYEKQSAKKWGAVLCVCRIFTVWAEEMSKCKSDVDCKFGPKKCWFIHQEDIVIAYNNAKSEGQM